MGKEKRIAAYCWTSRRNESIKKIARNANELDVKVLTLYAFSTENWKRPKDEVDYLLKITGRFLSAYLPELIEENVQVRIMGKKKICRTHT